MKIPLFSVILAFLITAGLPATAAACSIPPSSYPWIPGYGIYSHLDKENPLDKYDFIGIVTAELTPVEKDRFEYYYGNNPNLSSDQYSNVKFTILETLKGSEDKYFFYGRSKKDFSQKNQNDEPKIIFDKLMIKNPNMLANPREIIKYDEARRIAINRATTWSSSRDFHKTVDFRDLFDLSIP